MENNENKEEILQFKVIITDCRYYSDTSTWGCYNFSTEDDIPYYITQTDNQFDSDSSKKKFSSLVGKMQELSIGGEYLVKATYKKDKKYGHQYNPISVFALLPQSRESQLMFLQSIISPSIAENLINAYPNVVEDVVNGSLKTIEYSKVKGVREITWKRIKEKIMNNYLISDIITMLRPIGVTYIMIKKLLDDEPNPALLKQQIEKNPWILTRINGLGFKKVDQLALKIQPDKVDSAERLIAFIKWYFEDMGESEGHTWCSLDILKNAITNMVPECIEKIDWLLNNNEFLHISNDRVGLKYYYEAEMKIYNIIKEKSHQETKINFSEEQIDKVIKSAEQEQGFGYTEEQANVIRESLKNTVTLITGKAGTGKSTIMRAIIKGYKNHNYTVTSCALSAMAAQRIMEATSYPATTIHRALGCQGANKFQHNKDKPLMTDVMFMDEGSMTNASLFLHWLEAVGENTRIIIAGDHKQLPPIGYGNIFSDLLDMFDDQIVHKLTKPLRQAEKSGILVDANLIRENRNPITETLQPKLVHGELRDMYYMFRTNRQSLFDVAVKTFISSIKTDGIDNVVIAVPRRSNCLNSAAELNKTIQEKLLGDEQQQITYGDNVYKLGAKVIQTVNDYEKNVFNGEIGYISTINERTDGKKTEKYCIVTYTDALGKVKEIEYAQKELPVLDLAYALTGHKLQGAGRQTVIGIIDNTHYKLLDNCMLYTMLTRAKKRCLLLAEPQAFLHCIRTSHNNRNTWLSIKEDL